MNAFKTDEVVFLNNSSYLCFTGSCDTVERNVEKELKLSTVCCVVKNVVRCFRKATYGRLAQLVRMSALTKEWSNGMAHSINRFSLTPREAEAKALIVDQLRTNPRGLWVNSKKTTLPASRGTTPRSNKKK